MKRRLKLSEPEPTSPRSSGQFSERNEVLREAVRQAIRREALIALSRGEQPFEGQWLTPMAFRQARRRRRIVRVWQSLEALVFWGFLLVVSLSLLLVAYLVV